MIGEPEVTTYKLKNVSKAGVFEDHSGSIDPSGKIRLSASKGGCGSKGCNCAPGHWINVSLPRTKKGIVRGMNLKFNTRKELNDYLSKNLKNY